MKPSTILLTALVILWSGCSTVRFEPLSEQEKQRVRTTLAPGFHFPAGKEEMTYSLLFAAERLTSETALITAVHWKDATHATICFTAPKGSMHGGPTVNAVWDENEWKFGDWWFPA